MSSQVTQIQIRRGTNAQRKSYILGIAELGYTVDSTRVYCGDGTTLGGIPISNKNWGVLSAESSLLSLSAEVNDFAFINSKIYTLSATPNTLANWSIAVGKTNGTVTQITVGDYLNVNGVPTNKTITNTGSIQVDINSLLGVIYPVGTVYTIINGSGVFVPNGNPGQYYLQSGTYQSGVWNLIGTITTSLSSVLQAYQRVG